MTTTDQIFVKPSEADTCRKYVVPKLQAAGWETDPHWIAEQRTFTAGRIVVAGTEAKRQEAKTEPHHLLRDTGDFSWQGERSPGGASGNVLN